MFARIASFEGGNNAEMMRLAEEAMQSGQMTLPPGSTGGMVLVDEANGRRLFITWFDSQASIDAAAESFEKMGDEIPESIRGKRTSVASYEVAWNSWEDA